MYSKEHMAQKLGAKYHKFRIPNFAIYAFGKVEVEQLRNLLVFKGMLPGLVVNVKDSHSEPWSSHVSSIPRFT